MCGIWCYCGLNDVKASECVETLKARGPEETSYLLEPFWGFGFTRLAINGLAPTGGQPFQTDTAAWICNGEIYNHTALEAKHGFSSRGGSDCEVIGHLYKALTRDLVAWARALDGVFAIALYDKETNTLVLARDPYGVRPLYYGFIGATLYAASELKALPPMIQFVQAFPPGHVATFNYFTLTGVQKPPTFTRYHAIPWIKNPTFSETITVTVSNGDAGSEATTVSNGDAGSEATTIENEATAGGNTLKYNLTYEGAAYALRGSLVAAVQKRLMTERPVAALLSGGLDSSLIAALVQKELKPLGKPPLETYSIGFAGSEDLRHARLVADHIGSNHHEIVSTPEEFFAAIPEVIAAIESPDITTVRASVGNYLVAKYIKEHSEAKVIFNGDGADEVFGSYLYFYNAPSDEAYEQEVERLLTDIHHFDVLRSDRSISSNGLEPRTPFLDKQFVAVARSIPTEFLRPSATRPEKWILRKAFEETGLLPSAVLWRRKEAFSDGVSGAKPWYQEVQERVAATFGETVSGITLAGLVIMYAQDAHKRYTVLPPRTLEALYYRQYYDGLYDVLTIPYFWMPRWSDTTDPSARTLKNY